MQFISQGAGFNYSSSLPRGTPHKYHGNVGGLEGLRIKSRGSKSERWQMTTPCMTNWAHADCTLSRASGIIVRMLRAKWHLCRPNDFRLLTRAFHRRSALNGTREAHVWAGLVLLGRFLGLASRWFQLHRFCGSWTEAAAATNPQWTGADGFAKGRKLRVCGDCSCNTCQYPVLRIGQGAISPCATHGIKKKERRKSKNHAVFPACLLTPPL